MPPVPKYTLIKGEMRRAIAARTGPTVTVPASDLAQLLDYVAEVEEDAYDAWQDRMGDDL